MKKFTEGAEIMDEDNLILEFNIYNDSLSLFLNETFNSSHNDSLWADPSYYGLPYQIIGTIFQSFILFTGKRFSNFSCLYPSLNLFVV